MPEATLLPSEPTPPPPPKKARPVLRALVVLLIVLGVSALPIIWYLRR